MTLRRNGCAHLFLSHDRSRHVWVNSTIGVLPCVENWSTTVLMSHERSNRHTERDPSSDRGQRESPLADARAAANDHISTETSSRIKYRNEGNASIHPVPKHRWCFTGHAITRLGKSPSMCGDGDSNHQVSGGDSKGDSNFTHPRPRVVSHSARGCVIHVADPARALARGRPRGRSRASPPSARAVDARRRRARSPAAWTRDARARDDERSRAIARGRS